MKENKISTITNLFEGSEIRGIWDSEKEDCYFSEVDVIGVKYVNTNNQLKEKEYKDMNNV